MDDLECEQSRKKILLFSMFKQYIVWLTKNRSIEHFYAIQYNKCLLRVFYEPCAELSDGKTRLTKMKSLTSRRLHLGENTERERVNFNVLSAIREVPIGSHGIVRERCRDYGQMHV